MFWFNSAAASFGLALLAWRFQVLGTPDDQLTRSAAGIIAQIGATMLGFVLAALAIVATVVNTRLLRNMLKTGHYKVLLERMFGTVAACGIATLMGLSFVFLPPKLGTLHCYCLMALVLFATLCLYDMSRKFWLVLSHVQS